MPTARAEKTLAESVRLSVDSMPSSKPSEISSTGYPSCSSIAILSKKASTAAAGLPKHQASLSAWVRCRLFRPRSDALPDQSPHYPQRCTLIKLGPIKPIWSKYMSVPASHDDVDCAPRAELRVHRLSEAVARRVGKCATWCPAVCGVLSVAISSPACRWGLLCVGDGNAKGREGEQQRAQNCNAHWANRSIISSLIRVH